MNLFDGIQDRMFDTVGKVYGYDATWTPSAGGAEVQGRVLLKEPTKEYDLNGVMFQPAHRILEWRKGVLDGLFEAIRAKQNERVTVNGNEYFCRTAEAAYDGRTYKANIELIEP